MTNDDHPPIHSPLGVEYWDTNMKEYIMDPSPDPFTQPAPNIKQGWQPGDITDD